MNAKSLIAAAGFALMLSPIAFAQEANAPKTRAEVQAELAKARADGTMDYANREVGNFAPFAISPTRTRIEATGRGDGTLSHADAEVGNFVPPTIKTRAEVRAEAVKALAAGPLSQKGN